MKEEVNIIRQAVDRANDSFSIPVLVNKTVLHYYLTPEEVIAVTDIICFYEVGYARDSTNIVARCVIDAAYLEKNPDKFLKFYTVEALQQVLIQKNLIKSVAA